MEEKVHSLGYGKNSKYISNNIWDFTDFDFRYLKESLLNQTINDDNHKPHSIYSEETVDASLLDELEYSLIQYKQQTLFDNKSVLKYFDDISVSLNRVIDTRNNFGAPLHFCNQPQGKLVHVTLLDERAEILIAEAIDIIKGLNKN